MAGILTVMGANFVERQLGLGISSVTRWGKQSTSRMWPLSFSSPLRSHGNARYRGGWTGF
jgi:hypothetical protein